MFLGEPSKITGQTFNRRRPSPDRLQAIEPATGRNGRYSHIPGLITFHVLSPHLLTLFLCSSVVALQSYHVLAYAGMVGAVPLSVSLGACEGFLLNECLQLPFPLQICHRLRRAGHQNPVVIRRKPHQRNLLQRRSPVRLPLPFRQSDRAGPFPLQRLSPQFEEPQVANPFWA